MRKRIYVLRQCLAENILALAASKGELPKFVLKPVTVIDFPDGQRGPEACHEVEVHGPCKLVYDPDAPKARPGHPLDLIAADVAPLGTKIWLETEASVTLHWWGEDTFVIE